MVFTHCASNSFQSADCFSSKSAQLTTGSQRQIVRKKKEEKKGNKRKLSIVVIVFQFYREIKNSHISFTLLAKNGTEALGIRAEFFYE